MRVLRLCSVFEPRSLTPGSAAYDPIGGMQNHVAELTRCLDRLGVAQLVVTSRLAGPADRARFAAQAQVIRTGLPVPVLRQGWAPLAARHALARGRPDLVHVHCGEDLAVLPLARLAARRLSGRRTRRTVGPGQVFALPGVRPTYVVASMMSRQGSQCPVGPCLMRRRLRWPVGAVVVE